MTDNRLNKNEGHRTYIFDDDEPTVRESAEDKQFDDEATIREGKSVEESRTHPKYKAAFGKASVKHEQRDDQNDEETLRMPAGEDTVKMPPYNPEDDDLKSEPEAYLIRNSNEKKIWIDRSDFYVGSETGDNDYGLSNKYVSRQHAVIKRIEQGRYAIRDLGSTNGTFVDRKKILPGFWEKLREGSRVRLADEVFIFHIIE